MSVGRTRGMSWGGLCGDGRRFQVGWAIAKELVDVSAIARRPSAVTGSVAESVKVSVSTDESMSEASVPANVNRSTIAAARYSFACLRSSRAIARASKPRPSTT